MNNDEVVKELKEIAQVGGAAVGIIANIKHLIKQLEPEPEFIEGEIVKTHFNGVPVLVGFNILLDSDTNSYPARLDNIKNCKKLEALPMHMTKYDGNNKPKDCLVFTKSKAGGYNGGHACQFIWDHIDKFQILKDLNP